MNIPSDLVQALRTTRHVAVLTGAGVSAESGIPTFREAQTGFWARFDPQELATPEAFRRNPTLVWQWYEWRRGLIREADPNPGHQALAQMEDLTPRFTLITQNVDDLHRRAGNRVPIELHGNILRDRCFEEDVVVDPQEAVPPQDEEEPPRCPRCGSYLRPDVVWFGEALPQRALNAALKATQACDAFFSIGTSTLVHPASALPYAAVERGALTVEINPGETPVSPMVDYALRAPAGELLPLLLREVWPN